MTSFRGGAMIGWVSASGPLASLDASKDRLRLSVLPIGTYEFRPEEVVAIELKKGFLFGGVRIRHAVAKYPASILFQPLGGAAGVIDAVRAAGFTPSAPAPLPPRPLPYRWITVAACVVLWNILFLPYAWEFFESIRRLAPVPVRIPDKTVLAPLAFGFAFVWGVRLGPLRCVLLKPGRDFEEIKHMINLLCLILSFMLPVFAIVTLVGPGRTPP